MARIRMIKPEFFDDPLIGELSPLARLFFIGLWTQADREGRLVDDPRRLKVRIFPYDDVDVDALAVELHGRDVIRRYALEGQSYIWIRSFRKHQRPHPKEPASLIPECPDGAGKRHGEPCKNISDQQSNGTRNLDSGTRSNSAEALTRSTPADDSPIVLVFPTVGPDGPEWRLRRRQVDEWRTSFPNLDIEAEARKALAWVQAHPDRRKTRRGMPKFLVAWLSRSVDSRHGPGAVDPGSKSKLSAALEKASNW